MTFALHPVGGLCNRIQAVLSYHATHGPLDVYWDDAVPPFLSVFEPLPGVTFHDGSQGHTDYGIPDTAPSNWRIAYAWLRPIAPILERVRAFQGTLREHGPYCAIHVRRTDMTPLAARIGVRLPSDEEYGAWISEQPGLVWLATDNGETQAKYEAHSPRIRYGAKLAGSETVRDIADHTYHSYLPDAVVDLWMCAEADAFMGQPFGTFSGTIYNLRALK